MARMIPAEPWSPTTSPAEFMMFDMIRDQLDDDRWWALHSVGLTEHRSKPWAEIDFVVVGPPGVLCLEVKGGSVGRKNGKWYSRSHDGLFHDLGKGPFDQVAGAQAALRAALLERTPWFTSHLIGYGVVTPDCRFNARGPDIEPALVYDERDVSKPLAEYLRRLARYWSERYGGRKSLSPTDASRIVDSIRGDFHLVPSLKATVEGIDRQLLRLTQEQVERLEEIEENRAVVLTGGAGTGKTVLAVEEARRQAATGGKTLFCCFSKALAVHVRGLLAENPGVDAIHFHGLTSELIREAGYQHRLSSPADADHFEVDHPDLATEALLALDRLESYDTLILDEAQDLLTSPNLEFLSACLSGGLEYGRWRAFVDINQNLFGGVDDAAVGRLYGCNPTRLKLKRNCRNTKPIALTNSLLTGVGLAQTLVVDGPIPERLTYRDRSHEARLLARHLNRLLAEGLRPEDIVVITPLQRANSVFANPLPGGPVVIDYTERPAVQQIRHSTIRGFKGLESKAVVVCDIVDLDTARGRADLYVACSRAMALLTLVCAESTDDDYKRRAALFGVELVQEMGHRTNVPGKLDA